MTNNFDRLKNETISLMDATVVELRNGKIEEGLTNLATELYHLRQRVEPNEWDNIVNCDFFEHDIFSLLHQDPFTKHSFDKPRNYAGDADLIDYMYGLRKPADDTTPLGKAIYEWASRQATTQSVRARKKILASMIDEVVEESNGLKMLSIACGHLREAEISEAVQSKKVKQFFALDQDALSLEVVKNTLSEFNVIPIHTPFKSLFTNGKELQGQDFVYAAGLFDYLNQKISIRLTQRMFQMLNPGGRLLVANFAPCLPDIAYGEMFLRWKLIYREADEVADFASAIPKDEISRQRLFWDEPHNVIYLEIIKK